MKHATLFIEASDNLVEVARITEHEKKTQPGGALGPNGLCTPQPSQPLELEASIPVRQDRGLGRRLAAARLADRG